MKTRLRLIGIISVLCLAATTGTALAAHESNNRFDFRSTALAPDGDGKGVSNYIAGASTEDNELWNSTVRVSGLAPNTRYTFWAENGNDVRDAQDFAVCSFTTDPRGRGGCQRQRHNEPALAIARIRVGDMETFGPVALEARRMPMDADNKVDDGEIESSGGQRNR